MAFRSLFQLKKNGSAKSSSGTPAGADVPNGGLSKTRSLKYTCQIEELEQVFKKFDVNGDGKISSGELGSVMSCLGYKATEEELQKMITEIDADGDGFVSFDEFVELNTKGVDNEEALENLRDAFSVYDVDGNGYITAEELQQVMGSLGEECSLAECRRMISGVDSDGSGTIDFEEFKVMMMMGARWDAMESQRVGVNSE